MNTVKVYIGKGKQVKNLEMFNIVIDFEEALKYIFEYKGKSYLKFTLSKTKMDDKYGRTHAAYVNVVKNSDLDKEHPDKVTFMNH